jgi:hypothetical protein
MSACPEIYTRLISKHQEILAGVEKFSTAIGNLHYEGKVYHNRNLKSAEGVIKFFKEDFVPHMREDEDKVFPFIKRYVPRLEAIISFLKGEHAEISETVLLIARIFEQLREEVNETKKNALLEKLREKGTYLVCLIRGHVQTETCSVYQVIIEDLDKKELNRLEELLHH